MESDLLSIGRMARSTGLSVSALRFYDGAGILVPALVDPVTGYRWYAQRQVRPARLIAKLRRVGMPLPDIAAVLGSWPEPVAVRRLLGAHLRRLEDGLADARRELSRVDALLDSEENTMQDTTGTGSRLTVRHADLAAALRAVRFAVGCDPDLPMLHGILFDVERTGDGAVLRLVATDRYRMAVSAVPVMDVAGRPRSALVPVRLADEAYDMLGAPAAGGPAADAPAVVTIGAAGIEVALGGCRVSGTPLYHDFPDYRRLLRREDPPVHTATVDVAALRDALAAAEPRRVLREDDDVMCDVLVLSTDGGGGVTVDGAVGGAVGGAGKPGVGVNREFLLEALRAADRDQLTLELDGPIQPLAVRVPGDDRTFSVLMPIRLPEHAA